MSIDVNVTNDLVIVTETTEDIVVNVSNAAGPQGPAGQGVPVGGSTNQVLKKLSGTNYDTYWAADGQGVPYSGATGDVNLGEFQLTAGQLTLDTSPTGTAAVGTTRWNDTTGVSETTLKGGSVILKNGVDLVARVVNKVFPNATLTKAAYQAVRVSGAQGQRLAVAYAQANNDANSADTIGLVCETIATNQEGFIITVGQLENINTTGSLQGETWVDGDVLYLSPTTAGAITKVKPTGNGHIVIIGYVEYAHVNNGKIYVKVMNGWELDELHDVSIVSPANNEALIYESATSLWKNKTIATALGYTPISGTGVAGQVAYWNGTNSQTGSNNLFWDAANSRLGIGTNSPSTTLDIRGKTRIQSSGNAELDIIDGANQLRLAMGSSQGFVGTLTSHPFGFFTAASKRGEFSTNGNFILQNGGTFSDGGQRLQVYGDALVRGSGATSATNSLTVQNSNGDNILRLRNDLAALFNFVGTSLTMSGEANYTIMSANQAFYFRSNGGTAGRAFKIFDNASSLTGTSGANQNIQSLITFAPTSGTATYTDLDLTSTINQTGGANGITRGLYIRPTLTAAADWRSIEWSNNSGWGLYGAGTADNYLGGNLRVGDTTDYNVRMSVVGAGAVPSTGTGASNIVMLLRDTTAGGINVGAGIAFAGNDGVNTGVTFASINGRKENSTSGNYATYLSFATRANSDILTERVRITSTGNLGLGTTSPASYAGYTTLAINNASVGSIIDLMQGGTVRAQILSNVSTLEVGTAGSIPIVFYTNNNEKVRIFGNGNFGIGTGATDAGYKLDVNGTARVSGQITGNSFVPTSSTIPTNGMYLPSANTLGFATNSAIRATLDSSGNLGLGVIPSAWGSNTAFQIGNGAIWKSGSRSVDWITNGYYNDTNYIYRLTAAATYYRQFDGSHQFWNAPSGTAGNAITFTQAMTLTSGGNLLVGTTTDNGNRLQISGSGTFSNAVKAALVISDGVSSEGVIRIERVTVGTNTVIGALNFTNNNGSSIYGRVRGGRNTAGDGYVSLGTGISDNLFVLESGNVGIETISPTAALDTPASTTARATMRIRSGVAPTSPNDGDIWFDGTDIKMRIGGVTKTFVLV